jgi:DNA-binding MarR family transcriptional regulator
VAQQVHSRIWTAEVSDLLTSPQFGVLRVLSDEPGLDQRTVGEQVLLDKATGGDVIGRVARRGWVLSRQDPQDRRRNLLRLTAAGRRLLDGAVPAAERVQLALMEPLTRTERRVLLAVLLAIARSGAQPVPAFIAKTPGALIRVVQQVHNRMWTTELPDGLTPLQYAVLAALVRAPGVDQRTVAQRVVMDKATGTGVITRLVGRRWVRTRQDRYDRRRNLLWVTAAGQRLLDDARPRAGLVQQRLMLPLSPEEQDSFQRLTARVARLGPEQADCDID